MGWRAMRIEVLFAVFGLLRASVARGDPPSSEARPTPPLPLVFSWKGAPECRPEGDLREHLRRLLGQDFVPAKEAHLDVRVQLEQPARGLVARVTATATQGAESHEVHRELGFADCDDLASGLAIVTAAWLTEQASAATEPTTIVTDLPKTAEMDASSPPGSNEQAWVLESRLRLSRSQFHLAPRREPRLNAAVGPLLASGIFPEPSYGLGASVSYGFGPLRLRAEGLFMAPQRSYGTLRPQLGGRYTLDAGGVRVGYVFGRTRPLRLIPSGFVLIGRMRAAGLGLEESHVSTGAWGAAGLSNLFELKSGKSGVGLELALGLPFGRPRYLVDNLVVFRAPAWFGLAQVSAHVGFW